MSSVKPKIILVDTNFWRYLSDFKLAESLLRVQKKVKDLRKIAVAPTSIYEIANLQDAALKNRILKIACNPAWHRFPTDNFIMCEQLFSEIKALRPNWLTNSPKTPLYDALHYDYERRRGGWWDPSTPRAGGFGFAGKANKDDFYIATEEEKADNAFNLIAEGKKFKKAMQEKENKKYKKAPYKDILLDFKLRENQWLTGEHWRIEMIQNFWTWHKGGARDWLVERVNLNFLSKDNPDYIKFWDQVRPEKLSSFWLSGFFQHKSMLRKMNFGTTADISLARYCIDADYFVSADKVFIDLLAEAQDEADFKIATPILIKGGQKGIDGFIKDFPSGSTFC